MNWDKDYLNALTCYANEEKDTFFLNAGQDKRMWTLLNLIRTSKHELRFYEKESNVKNYHKDVIRELEGFMWTGNVKILLDKFPEEGLFSDFIKAGNCFRKIEMKITDRKMVNQKEEEAYFVLGDKSKFALFYDYNGNPRTMANFNNADSFNRFNKFFEEIFNSSVYSTCPEQLKSFA